MDPFTTLGLPRRYELDRSELESRYRELQKALHPDRHVGAGASQRRMSLTRAVEVNEAYRALKDDLRRAEALLALYGRAADGGAADAAEAGGAADPEFLMQVMELREALGDAKADKDLERVRALTAEVEAMQREARATLVQRFGDGEQAPAAAALAEAAALVSRLKYFRRFLDEVSVIEEEALG